MPASPRPLERSTAVLASFVAAAAAIAFLPALLVGFTSDDFFILSRVKQAAGGEGLAGYFTSGFFDYYRPVGFVSHHIDWVLWGAIPFGFHLTSLLLHGACSALVFLLGRTFLSPGVAALGAVLFAVHPAAHEPVYWVAARFDLLATFFGLLALLWLSGDGVRRRAAGAAALLAALLSKESAMAIVLLAPAIDILVGRRRAIDTARRMVPVVAAAAAYVLLRWSAGGLEPAGGGRGTFKLIAAVLLIAVLPLLAASVRGEPVEPGRSRRRLAAISAGSATLALMTAALAVAPLRAWILEKIGFLAYATFHLLSPIVHPAPPDWWFVPDTILTAVPGLVAAAVLAAMLAAGWHALRGSPAIAFPLFFVAAALVPVLSMTGGLRYLYMARAGVALLIALALVRLSARHRLIAAVVATALVVFSTGQSLQSGRRWRAGSDLTLQGVTLMAGDLARCRDRDIVLLTAPAGIGGVYVNINYESFDVLTGCSPRSFQSLLRVVSTDAVVEARASSPGRVTLRLPDYRGQIMATQDLSHFRTPVPAGASVIIESPLARIDSYADGGAQVFDVQLKQTAAVADLFVYSHGRIRAVEPARRP